MWLPDPRRNHDTDFFSVLKTGKGVWWSGVGGQWWAMVQIQEIVKGDREKKKNRCEKLGVWAMAMHEKWHGKTVL